MDVKLLDRARGCAVGAAVGDALGMPLEFGPRRPIDALMRDMQPGRLEAGTFTDDTEMALAVAESLLANRPLDQADLAQRFLAWYRAGPPDVGLHTSLVLRRIKGGAGWKEAARQVQSEHPQSAGNGSLMRCWPVALACWNDLDRLIDESVRQGEVTHLHPECSAACAFTCVTIFELLHGRPRLEAVARGLESVQMPGALRATVEAAPHQTRDELANSGWVRHTLTCAVWGLLTTNSFEEAVVQVANLGDDADTAASVAGALAGAFYGLGAIPPRWQAAIHGEWPLRSGVRWDVRELAELADRLLDRRPQDNF